MSKNKEESRVSRIKKLFDDANRHRKFHESEIEEAFHFTYPNREFNRRGESPPRRDQIYDVTATRGVRNLVTNTIRLLVPQTQAWAVIDYRNERLRELLESRLADSLSLANQRLFRHFSDSNFYGALTEALYDSVVAGTMCLMFIDIEGSPLTYVAVPLDQLYFLEDYDEQVDVVFREHKMTARQIMSRWPDDAPARIQEANEENPTKEFTILESVIPEGRGYEYCVHLKDGWESIGKPIRSDLNPFVVSRWEKSLGDVWGSSPVRQALPAIRTAQRIKRDNLVYNSFAAAGLWQVNDENVNVEQLSRNMQPGSVIPINEPLQPVIFPKSPTVGFEQLRLEQDDIKTMLFDSTPPCEDVLKYATAEALLQRRQEFFTQVGEPAQRLQRECLQPIAEQAVLRLQRRGEIVVLNPDQIAELNIPGIRTQTDIFMVNVNAALTKALQQQEAMATLQAYQNVAALVGPEKVNVHIDMNRLIRSMLVNFGVPGHMLKTEKEAARAMQQIEQAQIAQMMAQAAEAMGDSGQGMPPVA